MQTNRKAFYACAASLVAMATSAQAQDTAPQLDDSSSISDDIVVTARKREETALNVPVVVTALRGELLERLEVSDLSDMATLVPGLTMGESVTAVGMQVSIRGIGTIVVDPGVDQSVSLNIDGLQFSQGLAYMSGMFDVGQVEVLKGPQSLFFGKSSPGGVISLRSADPKDVQELTAKVGYEPEAREFQADLIGSGPVTDTLASTFALGQTGITASSRNSTECPARPGKRYRKAVTRISIQPMVAIRRRVSTAFL